MTIALVIVSIIAIVLWILFAMAVKDNENKEQKIEELEGSVFKAEERHLVTVGQYLMECAEHKKALKIINAYRKKDKIKVVSIKDKEVIEALLNAGYEINVCGIPREAGLITFINRGKK
jgi:membrane protein implicated in regulation of membrane protease activity